MNFFTLRGLVMVGILYRGGGESARGESGVEVRGYGVLAVETVFSTLAPGDRSSEVRGGLAVAVVGTL